MPANDTALITIVLPTYNRKEQLKKAVKSVTNQKVPGVIIHIFDNCSPDGTEEAVRQWMQEDSCIRYTRRDSNIGSLPNYVDALSRVETPYFIPLADDDWLLEGSIRILLTKLLADPSLAAVVSQTLHETTAGECVGINPGPEWETRRYLPEELIPLWVARGNFEWSSMLFRTSAKEAIGGPDITTDSNWDVDFQLRLFCQFPIEIISFPSAIYLQHPGQASKQINQQRYEGMVTMIVKVENYLRDQKPSAPMTEALKKFHARWVEIVSHDIAYHGRMQNFRMTYRKFRTQSASLSTQLHFLSKWSHHQWRILKMRLRDSFGPQVT